MRAGGWGQQPKAAARGDGGDRAGAHPLGPKTKVGGKGCHAVGSHFSCMTTKPRGALCSPEGPPLGGLSTPSLPAPILNISSPLLCQPTSSLPTSQNKNPQNPGEKSTHSRDAATSLRTAAPAPAPPACRWTVQTPGAPPLCGAPAPAPCCSATPSSGSAPCRRCCLFPPLFPPGRSSPTGKHLSSGCMGFAELLFLLLGGFEFFF